jgi:hypothetical protein
MSPKIGNCHLSPFHRIFHALYFQFSLIHGPLSGAKREIPLRAHEIHLRVFFHDVRRMLNQFQQVHLAHSHTPQYDAGVLGGVLLHKPFLDAIDNPTGVWIIPMISASYSLAACVTSFFVATFAFQIGRRGTIILGCFVAILGSVVQSASYSVAQLIIGRILTVSSFVKPMWFCRCR